MSQEINPPRLARLPGFSPDSKVWVYTCHRALSTEESAEIQSRLDQFCRQWTAHNQALQAAAEVYENEFVLLMVDETKAGASGCSIDTSVHFLENLGETFQVDFFERMRFGWLKADGELNVDSKLELTEAVRQERIKEDTLMLNTLVQKKSELDENWLVPFQKSWHRRVLGIR